MSQNMSQITQFFTPIIDSHALMTRSGEYFEAPLFHRHHELFVKVGKNFIKLHPSAGGTSKTGVYWKDLHFFKGTHSIREGRLVWEPVTKKKAA